VSGPVKSHVSGTVTSGGPTLEVLALPGVELIDAVRTGITSKKDPVVVHRDLSEMARTGRWGNHIRYKLIVSRARLRLQDTHAFIRIESCILAAVAKVDEVCSGVVEEAVRIGLDLEILNQPETPALQNPRRTRSIDSSLLCLNPSRSYNERARLFCLPTCKKGVFPSWTMSVIRWAMSCAA
jgi:hypothetical protein